MQQSSLLRRLAYIGLAIGVVLTVQKAGVAQFADFELPENASLGTDDPSPFEYTEEQEETASSSSSAVSEQSQSTLPTFFRSGQQIEPNAPPPPPPEPEPEITEEVFESAEQPPEGVSEDQSGAETAGDNPADESEMTDEQILQMLEEEEVEEEEAEEPKESAPQKPLILRLMDRLKYLIAAIGLGVGGGVYFFTSRKKKAGATATGDAKDTIPAPPKANAVEEKSERLEHALNQEDEDGEDAQDESVGFSEEPPVSPSPEEK